VVASDNVSLVFDKAMFPKQYADGWDTNAVKRARLSPAPQIEDCDLIVIRQLIRCCQHLGMCPYAGQNLAADETLRLQDIPLDPVDKWLRSLVIVLNFIQSPFL
jgi:hypothetical protein